jgi:hypothetical protein
MAVSDFMARREIALAKLLDPPAWDETMLAHIRSGAKEIYFRRHDSAMRAAEIWRGIDAQMSEQGVKLADVTEADVDAHLTI